MSTGIDLGYQTFAGLPMRTLEHLSPEQVAISDASGATPYGAAVASHSALAPSAIRAAFQALSGQLKQDDFYKGRTLLTEDLPIDWIGIDLGDARTRVRDDDGNRRMIAAATSGIIAADADDEAILQEIEREEDPVKLEIRRDEA